MTPLKDSRQRFAAIVLLAVVLVTVAGLFRQGPENPRTDREARQRLDDLLGREPEPPVFPQSPPQDIRPPGFPEIHRWLDDSFSRMTQAIDPVEIEETPAEYVIRIRLGSAGRTEDVQVSVQPHIVQIQGSFKDEDEAGFSSTRQFMRTFTSQVPLDPANVSRTVHDQVLTVRIPKREPDTSPSLPPAETGPESLSPEVLRELQNAQPRSI